MTTNNLLNSGFILDDWLDSIISGKKTYEARINNGLWNRLKIGSVFYLGDTKRIVIVEVLGVKYFKDFGDAWFLLQDRLIPSDIHNIVSMHDARKFYSAHFSAEDINKHGVIAVELQIIPCYI